MGMWDKEIEAYHQYLPGNFCADTTREHEKAKARAETQDRELHYVLKLPKKCRIDNFVFSADYTKVDCRRFLVKKEARGAQLIAGCVTWVVAFNIGSDAMSGKNDDLVELEDLLKQANIMGSGGGN